MFKSLSNPLDNGAISRRSFLKGAAGLAVAVVVVDAASLLAAGCKSEKAADLTVTSSTDANHSHKITVLGADIDNPPGEKVITSDGATHTHTVTLTKADYQAIRKGQSVSKVSSATGTTPHTHTFAIKKL